MDSVQKSPRKARPYANLGYAYLNSADYDKALETTRKAIEIDPQACDRLLKPQRDLSEERRSESGHPDGRKGDRIRP